MADYNEILLQLTKRLYPAGRAYKMPPAGNDSPPSKGMLERLHTALAKSENRAITAGLSIMDSTLPDNANFDEDDCTNWERCLGIYSAVGTTLADRKLAIKTKLNYPGTTAARQHYTYIQSVLRSAGYDVHVYENRFLVPPSLSVYETKTPYRILGVQGADASLGGFSLNEANLAGGWIEADITIAANYIEEERDAEYGFTDNLRTTFFISGSPITTFADVDAVRKIELRQLILQLKPQNSVGFLFINYI